MNYVIAWGTLLSGLAALVLAAISVALVKYDVRLRERQLSESRARASSALEVELHTSVHYRTRGEPRSFEPVLETRVFIKNISSEILAVPLVYLQTRAAPEVGSGRQVQTFSEWNFDGLGKCEELSHPLNVARFKGTVLYIPPGERESVVRWDVLTESFIHEFPLVVVRLEVFSVPDSVMQISYPSGSSEKLAEKHAEKRAEWLEFIDGQDGIRHHKVIVSTAPKDIQGGPKKDGWAFLEPGSGQIDEKKSQDFHEILAKMSKTGRQNLVALGDELSKRRSSSLLLIPRSTQEVEAREEGAFNPRPTADA